MLLNLYVKNMALIEEADISFTEGLNILTGETGAGKSIIIGSINIALGNKVSQDIIRKGAEYALVELTFKIDSKEKLQALRDMDIEELDEGQVVISRKITGTRSAIKVNGETVTAGQMKKIASLLIDIHGQNEHQSLLDETKHLILIDSFAGEDCRILKEKLKEEYAQYTEVKNKLDDMCTDEESRQREIAFMEFEINEIESAKLSAGEDIELEQQFRRMSNSQKIMEDIAIADRMIAQGDDNASDMVGKAVRAIINAAAYDDNLSSISDSLSDIESMLNDVGREISNYMSECEFDEEEYSELQNRLNLINSFKMKYGKSIDDIIDYMEDKQRKLDEYNDFDNIKVHLEQQKLEYESVLDNLSNELTKVRQFSAKRLAQNIKKALLELNFLDVRFDVEFEKAGTYSANGMDCARFMISTNPGEDMKPLAKIASGGEMSRIMLAIKTVLADKDDIGTLIFDEIDAGISGRTAQMVSDKLSEIAHMHQIICITHLPQIAAMADTHFVIEKSTDADRTRTQISKLGEEQSIGELARLLGGAQITDTVISNAREMKNFAKNSKQL